MRDTALTLLVAAGGATLAWAIGMPAPFLTGPAFCVSAAAVAGMRARIPDRMRDASFVLVGTGMGTGVTPEAVSTAAQWPLSLAILTVGLAAILFLGTRLLMAFFGFDRLTAYLAASPGHLSFVLGLSAELRADMHRVAIVQSLRILTLTLLVPLVVAALSDADLTIGTGTGPAIAPGPLAVLLIGAGLLGLVMKRLRLPAAFLLAGMAVSAAGHVTEVAPGSVPVWLAVPAFVTMGALIGSRFSGVTTAELRNAAGAAAMLTVFAVLVSLVGAILTSNTLGIPIVTALIAFAPGGVETMAAMSVMLDADPAFVATHHVFRLIVLSVLVPLMLPPRPTEGPSP